MRTIAANGHSYSRRDHSQDFDDKAIAEYMTAVLETNEPDPWLLALSDIARAKGMTQVAKDAGPGRESLYKALAPGATPRFETAMKVARAVGVQFTAQPACARARARSNLIP